MLVAAANWLTGLLLVRSGFFGGAALVLVRVAVLGRFRFRGGGGGGGVAGGFALPLPILRNPPATWMLSRISSSSASGAVLAEERALWISRSSCSFRRLFHFPVGSLPSERKRFLGFLFFGVGEGAAEDADDADGEDRGEDVVAAAAAAAVVVVVGVVVVPVLPASSMGGIAPPNARRRRRTWAGGEGVREIGGSRW